VTPGATTTEDQALAADTAALTESPHDLGAWHRLAGAILSKGRTKEGLRALSALGRAAIDQGSLALALLLVKELEPIGGGGDGEAQALLAEAAAAYGAGSKRLADRFVPHPPPAPHARSATAPAGDMVAAALRAIDEAADALQVQRDLEGPAKVPRAALLSELDPASFVDLVNVSRFREEPKDAAILRQGDVGRSIFLVLHGLVRIARRDSSGETTLGHLRPGQFFGEMALLGGGRRNAWAVCDVPTALLEADRSAIEEAAKKRPPLADVLARHGRDRLLSTVLQTSPLFRPLEAADRPALAQYFASRQATAGEVLVEEGSKGPGLFVVLTGEVEVSRTESSERLVLARLGAGDLFGEMSMVADRPATATVRALDRTVMLFLPRAAFDQAMERFPNVRALIDQTAADREQATAAILTASAEAADDLVIV
jgi:CRP-like cAMP-binding protein